MIASELMTHTLDVIIATNRRSPFLEEALASVAAQREVDCNVVVVDDGSPCPDYLRRCASNSPRTMVVRQAHAGLAAARNRGLREGNGAFVAFLDDDDAWHPLKAQKQLEALAREPAAVGCFCWGSYVDSEGKVLGSWSPATACPSSDFITGAMPLPRIVTLVVRRDACEGAGGFDETYEFVEDMEFMFRLLLHGEFVAVADKLVYYRQHAMNISHGVATEARNASDRMILDLIARCDERGDSKAAALFRERHPKVRAEFCMSSLRRMGHAVRHRSRSELADEARWFARHLSWLPGALPKMQTSRRAH